MQLLYHVKCLICCITLTCHRSMWICSSYDIKTWCLDSKGEVSHIIYHIVSRGEEQKRSNVYYAILLGYVIPTGVDAWLCLSLVFNGLHSKYWHLHRPINPWATITCAAGQCSRASVITVADMKKCLQPPTCSSRRLVCVCVIFFCLFKMHYLTFAVLL